MLLLYALFIVSNAINLDWIPADDKILPASKDYRDRLANLCVLLEKNGFQNLGEKEEKMKNLCSRLKEEESWKEEDPSNAWIYSLIIVATTMVFLFKQKIVDLFNSSSNSAPLRLPSPEELEKIRQTRLEFINNPVKNEQL